MLIYCFFCFQLVVGQTINRKYFKESKWFSNNINHFFYSSDTVKIIKYSNFGNQESRILEDAAFEIGGDCIEIAFLKKSVLLLDNILVKSWEVSTKVGWHSWKFNSSTETLVLFFKRKPIMSFRALSLRDIKVKIFYIQPAYINTTEITLVRIKGSL